MNQYHEYQSLQEMKAVYKEIQDQLEQNGGELTDELQIALSYVDDTYDEMIFRIYNIIQEVEGVKERRQAEIKRLQEKAAAEDKSVKAWKDLLKNLIKERGTPNKSGNLNFKVNDLSFTVTKSTAVVVEEDFDNPAFTSYVLGEKVSPLHKQSIENFLKQYAGAEEVKFSKAVDKTAIKKAIAEGLVVEGAHLETSENLSVR